METQVGIVLPNFRGIAAAVAELLDPRNYARYKAGAEAQNNRAVFEIPDMLATILEQQLRNRVPLSVHPIDRAPLRILESANMPAVLLEMGFLSNAEQEKQLTVDVFQAGVVQSIYEAVVRFRDSLNAGGGR